MRRKRRVRTYPPEFVAKVLAAYDARGDRQLKQVAAAFDLHPSTVQRMIRARRQAGGQAAPVHPPVPPPGQGYPPEFKARALAWLASSGKPVKEIARELKIDPSTLRDWRRAAAPAEIKRSRGRYQGKVTEEQRIAAVAEYNAGRKAKEIAAELGVSASALLLWAHRINGTTPRATTRGKLVALPKGTLNGNGHGERLPAPVEIANAARDARTFLRHAKRELIDGIRRGELDDLDSAHLLSLLALRSLEGRGNA